MKVFVPLRGISLYMQQKSRYQGYGNFEVFVPLRGISLYIIMITEEERYLLMSFRPLTRN